MITATQQSSFTICTLLFFTIRFSVVFSFVFMLFLSYYFNTKINKISHFLEILRKKNDLTAHTIKQNLAFLLTDL